MSFPPENSPPPPEEQAPNSQPDGLPGYFVPAAAGPLEEAPGSEAWSPDAARRSPGSRTRRLAWELLQTLVLAVLIFLSVRAIAQNFRVEGSSMEPGLHNGQYLLVNKAIYLQVNLKTLSKYIPFIHAGDHDKHYLFRGPRRGDVVVFRFPQDPSRDFIKRVIAVPGDTVQVINGRVLVNGVELNEPYIENLGRYDYPLANSDCVRAGNACVVPASDYFVLGDNRNNSYDSHTWGFVPRENIIGQAVFSYWPLSDLGGVGNRTIHVGLVNLPLPW